MNPKVKEELKNELISTIIKVHDLAHRLGYHITGQAVEKAKNALGWELAGDKDMAILAARGKRENEGA